MKKSVVYSLAALTGVGLGICFCKLTKKDIKKEFDELDDEELDEDNFEEDEEE